VIGALALAANIECLPSTPPSAASSICRLRQWANRASRAAARLTRIMWLVLLGIGRTSRRRRVMVHQICSATAEDSDRIELFGERPRAGSADIAGGALHRQMVASIDVLLDLALRIPRGSRACLTPTELRSTRFATETDRAVRACFPRRRPAAPAAARRVPTGRAQPISAQRWAMAIVTDDDTGADPPLTVVEAEHRSFDM